MGWQFMLTRFIVNLFGIAAIAFITEKVLSADDRADIYKRVNEMQ